MAPSAGRLSTLAHGTGTLCLGGRAQPLRCGARRLMGRLRRWRTMDEGGESAEPVRWMPLASARPEPTRRARYHDLGQHHPGAPVPATREGRLVRRARLWGASGVPRLLDWVAAGDLVVVEMGGMMGLEGELLGVLESLSTAFMGDMGGHVVQLGEERLLLIPAGVPPMEGVDSGPVLSPGS